MRRNRISKQAQRRMSCAAVVPAAGASSRMGGQDKLFCELGGIPVLARTLLCLERCAAVDEIVIPTRQESIVAVAQLCRDFAITKVTQIIPGGPTRLQSVLAGVRQVDKRIELVAVHDAARPFVSRPVICEAVDAAAECSAAAPAVPVKDTIKRARDNIVVETPDRAELFAVQTPQVFERSLLLGALSHAAEENLAITDDCSAVEAVGMRVRLTRGDYCNIKLTTPEDFMMAQAILDWGEEGESAL